MTSILLVFCLCVVIAHGEPREESFRIKRARYAQYFRSDFLGNDERYRNFRGPTFRSSDIAISDKRCLDVIDKIRSPAVTVETRQGTVQGRYFYLCDGPGVPEYDRPKQRNNQNRPKVYRNITTFLGIPYARPPTKENGLRFKPPQFPPSWGVIPALQYKPACPQSPTYFGVDKGVKETSEDCLYLNVFSPFVSLPLHNKYAVMVYIHGGDWDHGNANSFPAHMLVASQEVVVVTLNYRVGPLGFLATANNASAGNYGILDQAMAIEWVFDNIDAFNGDRQRITLFGPGVGAASAGLHILSVRLGTKIRRVIAQSGAPVADWAMIMDPTFIYNNSAEFAKKLNCKFNSSWRMVNCLRDRTITELQTTSIEPKVGWLQWGPVVDGHTRERERQFLPEPPEVLLKRSEVQFHQDFAYMAGVTRDEAVAMILKDRQLKSKKYKISRNYFQEKVNKFIQMYNYTLDTVALTKAISFLYMPWWDPENSTLLMEGYIDMLSDSYYNAPNDKMVKLLLEKGVKTYMYVLNYTADGIKNVRDRDQEVFNQSVPHNAEYYFITGAPFMDHTLYPLDLDLDISEWTEADRNMSEFFMTAWANFAKFGNPTPIPLFQNIKWKPMSINNLQYLLVNTTNFTSIMMTNYRQKENQFWNSYLPNLMGKIIPTWPPTLEPWEEQRDIYQASLWGVIGATGLFLILSVLCCCLYCRTKSKHLVSTEDIPEAVCTTPTSIDTLLNMKKTNMKDRYLPERVEIEEKHTQV